MNKDQIKGNLKVAEGKIQESVGKLVGNEKQEAKGLVKQIKGNAQKSVGDVKEVITDAVNK